MQRDAVIGQSLTKAKNKYINKTPAIGKDGIILYSTVLFFFSIPLQDETLNGTSCGETAAVWIDWNPNCYIKWLTWRWMGVNAVSSYFPPWTLQRENLKLEKKQRKKPTQSSSANVMDRRGRPLSSKWIEMENEKCGLVFICFPLCLHSLLCCFLHCFHSWRAQNITEMLFLGLFW